MDLDVKRSMSEEKARLQEEQRKADFEWLTEDERGRRIVRFMLEQTHVYHSTFNPDASIAAFNEGVRSVGLKILDMASQTRNFDLVLKGEADA